MFADRYDDDDYEKFIGTFPRNYPDLTDAEESFEDMEYRHDMQIEADIDKQLLRRYMNEH